MTIAARPPVVIPLSSSAFPTAPMSGLAKRSNWKAAAIQKQTPATATRWLSRSFWMTVLAPSTKRPPVTIIR